LKKEWNKSCETFYREYRKDAKKRMTMLSASRRDRYDDVSTLAFRKSFKDWDFAADVQS
jgi:hypothetical protein